VVKVDDKNIDKSRLIITTTFATLALLIAVLVSFVFGGKLTTTLVGVIVSIMAPTLGGLFTLIVVNPLREMKKEQNTLRSITIQNGQKIGEIRVLVDGMLVDGGELTKLRNDILKLREISISISNEIQILESSLREYRDYQEDQHLSIPRVLRSKLLKWLK